MSNRHWTNIFRPDVVAKNIFDITPEWFIEQKIQYVFTDLDNTLCGWAEKEISQESKAWIESLLEAGLKVAIISNNLGAKLNYIANQVNVPVITSRKKKPFRGIFKKAMKTLGCTNPAQCAMIGDISVTDIWAPNRLGMLTILVLPLTNRDFIGTKIYRWFAKRYNLRKPRNQHLAKWETPKELW